MILVVQKARLWVCAAFLLCLSCVYAQPARVGQNVGSLVYIDGMNVTQSAELKLNRDQILRLEAYDLKPHSTITFRAQKRGLKIFQESYKATHRGDMKAILFFPKANSKIRCTVHYVAENGKKKKLQFGMKPAW